MDEKFPIGEHVVDHLENGEKSISEESVLNDWVQSDSRNKIELGKYQK